MPELVDVRAVRGKAPGDQYDRALDEQMRTAGAVSARAGNPMDSPEMRRELRMLLEWFYLERERQASNRMEMATDADFYDNIQWDPEDKAAVEDRGQMALVYNEVAPMVDWLIGTERRSRVDWSVLPRTEDDVQIADVKTKVLKYVSDINRVVFNRSRAFADTVKVGVGWVDDGMRDDPTQDVLYSRYEDWRNVLWDSSATELDLSDARYLFRWRWVDLDVACLMFPNRADVIRAAAEDQAQYNGDPEDGEDTWDAPLDRDLTRRTGVLRGVGAGMIVDAKRRRVKLIECQYRKPAQVKVVVDGAFKGAVLTSGDQVLGSRVAAEGATIVDKLMMRMHFAVFIESAMLGCGPSIYRHNRFTLTPIWCYRRGRDKLPYGVIRRVRDIQQDLNKRASKALFFLNSNQIIMDEGATADPDVTRDEADRPDGMLIKRPGKELLIRRDTDAATGQIQMMGLAAQTIQKSAGVADENLGRQTNAVSGEAIKARQTQGSVVTTEPFDNLRLATQIQGEKQLSLTEQFYTEEKVIRLTGVRGALEWLRVNQPEMQGDGTVRFLNDITASQADFMVHQQDYAGTLRQVMFDSLNQLAQRMPPELGMRFLRIAFEFSDLPNKDEIAQELRTITGERDPNKEMTPEELQQAQAQLQAQAESMELQRQTAIAALEEQRAKVRELNAKAAKLESEAQDGEGLPDDAQHMIQQLQEQAAQRLEEMSAQLSKAQAELANRTLQIRADADTKVEIANIDRDTQLRVAEIQKASDKAIESLLKRMDDMAARLEQGMQTAQAQTDERIKQVEQVVKDVPATAAPAAQASPAPAPAVPTEVHVALSLDKPSGASKRVVIQRDSKGAVTGAEILEGGAEPGAAPASD